MADATAQRRWYAEDLRLRAPVTRNLAIVEAFAAVPRERFLGPPPWRVISDRRPDQSFVTPDGDPGWIYHDVLVTIDEARRLNNGAPSLWAASFDQLDLRRGQRVLQVGAGTGYYAAVLAEIVGPEGRVIAVEYDDDLAARARTGLGPWANVEAVHGDGRAHDPGEVDVVIVCAGSTHPAALWLDRLAPGGQLLMPLTTDNRWGFLLRATRSREPDARRFEATSIGPVGIFPCVGGRDEQAAVRLEAALIELRRASWLAEVLFAELHRGEPSAETWTGSGTGAPASGSSARRSRSSRQANVRVTDVAPAADIASPGNRVSCFLRAKPVRVAATVVLNRAEAAAPLGRMG